MRRRTSRRMTWAVLLLLLLALVLPPFINVNRYRNRVMGAIGRALGRDVTVSSIQLKLLPRPGLVLNNFVVADAPAYGAEPMLRANTVTAYIRITSLWRGRMEIGTLDLDNPSLNLVRRADGHWNLEELLERASQASPAPTGNLRSTSRPRFPYVEASSGRINFKLGEAKKPFAFTDADFALWVDSESSWGVRLEGRPVRTDVSINDTGRLKLDGRFQRAANLRDTAVYLRVSFSDGPLGQITKLVYGRDRGWRGTVGISSVLTGSPGKLEITADGQVDDFRRYDIASGETLRLRTHCTGTYAYEGDSLHDVNCESPVGTGTLRVKGNAERWGMDGYELGITGEHIPAERFVAFARHAKKDLPSDLTATGEVEGTFSVRDSAGAPPQWSGGGKTTGLALHADVLKQDLQLGEIEFGIPSPEMINPKRKRAGRPSLPAAAPAVFQIAFQPFAVPLGAASPAIASGVFAPATYQLHLSGSAELERLLSVAQAVGIATPGVGLAGSAQLDLDVAGAWTGFAPPAPSGKLQIRTATAELQGVSEPILIDSASLTLNKEMVTVGPFSAGFTKGGQLAGSASFPVHCTSPESCLLQFDVRAEDVSLMRLNQLLNPAFGQPWYHLLDIGRRHSDILLKLSARGRFVVPRLDLGTAAATNVNGSLELSSGKLRIHELRADVLGGHEDGSWLADFTVSPPRFMGNGVVSKIALSQLGSLMHDNWATGSLDASFSLVLSGLTAAKLRTGASGTADFTWSNGVLRHVSLDNHGSPMAFSKFFGKLSLQDGTFTLSDGKLQSANAIYSVKGTASYDRSLALKMERSTGPSYAISGTLESPRVQTVNGPPAEAALR
ncbi:MAG TPA: AsmA family protein [Terriglobales bacterium]|nr:AsmA family protein [Terriglobales bacterium]